MSLPLARAIFYTGFFGVVLISVIDAFFFKRLFPEPHQVMPILSIASVLLAVLFIPRFEEESGE